MAGGPTVSSMTSQYARTVGDREIPLPGTYVIDPVHTFIGFQVLYLGLSMVRGRFTDLGGVIVVAEDPADSTVQVAIRSASVDTARPRRDEHLRSDDFLGAEEYPNLAFVSTGLTGLTSRSEAFRIHGDLTIRGKTCPITLAATFNAAAPDLLGDSRQPRIGFTARATINRDDFGITFNQALETGGWVIGKEVQVALDVQAYRR